MELLNKLNRSQGMKPIPKTAKNAWLSVLIIVPSVLDSSSKLLSPKVNYVFNFKIHFFLHEKLSKIVDLPNTRRRESTTIF
jgi:hypothetical protein